ncbi:lysophospholipase [Pontibacter korlensis]|uniref:Lysophospholipase n=1 Tax=Pontibacter korlensis TaxID=400092 RepID=A0A0E3UYT3_9BACT|nr:lysophospholipase [Pontibacter korlensis]
MKEDNLVFLFQGDSITDGNRGRDKDPNHIMGHGYAFSIASRVGARFAEKGLTFHNRGISGNTVPDLLARWQQDTLALKPDVLSILVGVNDTDLALRQKDAEATAKYKKGYSTLLSQTKEQLPDSLLVLCEPFVAPVGRVKEHWSEWQSEVRGKQEVVERLAKEYNAVFVPLQTVFDKAALRAPADYWIWDGIHPTVAGHELIAQEWLKQVSKRVPFLKKL